MGFQFTPLREGRQQSTSCCTHQRHFNSRPSARGDTPSGAKSSSTRRFQFTPLREGRQALLDLNPLRGQFQFTPLREGRRHHATCKARKERYFNSRPSARGDAHSAAVRCFSAAFQFTPLREGRRVSASRPSVSLRISIHAPPRGATFCGFPTTFALQISIHAPPRGATAKDMQFLQIFCSTLTNQHGLTIMPRNLSRLFW